jgi:hypothetical protein
VNGNLIDMTSIWMTRLLVLSLPLMLFNPMNPEFYRLQISELLAIITFLLIIWRFLFVKEKIKIGRVGKSLIVFNSILILSAIYGINSEKSMVEVLKIIYLSLLGSAIYINSIRYSLGEDLIKWTMWAFLIIIVGGLVGGLLLLVGVHTSLAEPSRIIGVALGVHEWLPVIPRITSFFQPTANLLAAYLAVLTLPVVDYLFRNIIPERLGKTRILLLLIIATIGVLTMSRAVIGVFLAIWLGITYFNWEIPVKNLWKNLAIFTAITGWISLEFYTVFYPLDIQILYSFNPEFTKEIVDLGTKQVPNPVYFMRNGIGLERITLDVSYAFNHYLWLKYIGWKLFEIHPWLGVGIGAFSDGAQHLAEFGLIDQELTAYRSAQSQYFTLIAEIGLLGCLSFFAVIFFLVQKIKKSAGAIQKRSSLLLLLCLPIIALIAVDMDVLSYRWLWGITAILLSIHELNYSILKK